MIAPRALFALLAAAFALHAQDSLDPGEDLTSEALWSAQQPPSAWEPVSATEGARIFELRAPPEIFGLKPQQVQAYYKGDELEEIQITYLEAGNFFGGEGRGLDAKKGQKAFEAALESAAERLEADLGHRFGKGRRVNVGSSQRLKSRVTEYAAGEVLVRVYAEEGQLLLAALLRARAATGKILADRPRKNPADNVVKLPNGDVIVENIPMIEQGDRGYCAMGTLAMVTRYYGLSLNIDLVAAKAGYRQGDVSNADILPTYQACAREGKLRLRVDDKFDFKKAQRHILKGYPVIVARRFDRVRDAFHSEFARKLAQDPAATLPKPDRSERQRWPGRTGSGHVSLATGFNEARKEILFTESWGENMRNRRMLGEEMEETASQVYYFTPL